MCTIHCFNQCTVCSLFIFVTMAIVLQTLWGHDFVIPIVDNMILIFLDNPYLKISVSLTDSRFMFWDDTDIGGYPLPLLCWGMQFLLRSVL